MTGSHTGELAALATAVFWTITSLSFEFASRRVGSLSVNLIRLVLAVAFYSVFQYARNGSFLPSGADEHAWIWLSISGIIGFVIGDYCLFSAFAIIGARVSMLVMALVPPMAAFLAYLVLGESFSWMNSLGMTLTLLGIVMVLLTRSLPDAANVAGKGRGRLTLRYHPAGIALAFVGALGQASGLVLSKLGMREMDAFAASYIRVLAGLGGFLILFILLNSWAKARKAIADPQSLKFITIGSIFGPFLGVSFSLLAIQHTTTGIAATIMSVVPVLIIPPAVILLKEKVVWKEIIGAVIAVCGVAVFFL